MNEKYLYLLYNAIVAMKKENKKTQKIVLNNQQRDCFISIMDNPPKANDELKELLNEDKK